MGKLTNVDQDKLIAIEELDLSELERKAMESFIAGPPSVVLTSPTRDSVTVVRVRELSVYLGACDMVKELLFGGPPVKKKKEKDPSCKGRSNNPEGWPSAKAVAQQLSCEPADIMDLIQSYGLKAKNCGRGKIINPVDLKVFLEENPGIIDSFKKPGQGGAGPGDSGEKNPDSGIIREPSGGGPVPPDDQSGGGDGPDPAEEEENDPPEESPVDPPEEVTTAGLPDGEDPVSDAEKRAKEDAGRKTVSIRVRKGACKIEEVVNDLEKGEVRCRPAVLIEWVEKGLVKKSSGFDDHERPLLDFDSLKNCLEKKFGFNVSTNEVNGKVVFPKKS